MEYPKVYRKKPISIIAWKYTYPASEYLRAWLGNHAGQEMKARHPNAKGELIIKTLEDGSEGQVAHVATEGDYIIQGVQGEFYPCKPDIFEQTYDFYPNQVAVRMNDGIWEIRGLGVRVE